MNSEKALSRRSWKIASFVLIAATLIGWLLVTCLLPKIRPGSGGIGAVLFFGLLNFNCVVVGFWALPGLRIKSTKCVVLFLGTAIGMMCLHWIEAHEKTFSYALGGTQSLMLALLWMMRKSGVRFLKRCSNVSMP